ncbi:MAG: adenylate/guanylate cyclase domain-containing protein [Acidimicrobiales bacterium]
MTADAELEATVAFVDLAGFTALTDAHGDRAAVDLVSRFESMIQHGITGRGRLVKMIGDAAMVAFDHPAHALEGLRAGLDAILTADQFPLPRVGLHHGPVIDRGGDLFGATVNLAARVAGQARGGQVLATEVIAVAARNLDVGATDLGTFDLHNLTTPVRLFDLDVGVEPSSHTIDPVCRMRVDHRDAAGRLQWNDHDHWFCSLQCAAAFATDPALYASAEIG